MKTHLATLLLLLGLLSFSAALAAGPVVNPRPVPPRLEDNPNTKPLAELPAKKQQAIKNALARIAGLSAVAKKHKELAAKYVERVKLEQARRAAGVNVLNGIK